MAQVLGRLARTRSGVLERTLEWEHRAGLVLRLEWVVAGGLA